MIQVDRPVDRVANHVTENRGFIRHASIQMAGYRTLEEGQPVLFDAIEGAHQGKFHRVAVNVRPHPR